MGESESKTDQQKNFHYSVAQTDSHTYIEGTPAPDELVKICDRIPEGNVDQKDIILQKKSLVTANSQYPVQQSANSIINVNEIGKFHNGDYINNISIINIITIHQDQVRDEKISEKVLDPTNSQKQLSLTLPELNSFEFEVVNLDDQGRETKRERKQAQYFPEDLGNGILLEMVSIQAGRFQMGASREEDGSPEDERPQHLVNIKPFFMGRYPITQAQWKAIANLPKINRHLNPEPSYFKGDNLPVERVSWYEAQEFCARISQKTGRIYRLPSEAEWEYACRARTSTPFYFGKIITTNLANYCCENENINSINHQCTTQVGKFPANEFGLYDIHGNVWEWCADYEHDDYQGAPSDGSAWVDDGEEYRILRGGSWVSRSNLCRSASRFSDSETSKDKEFGFRVVCDLI
ncbi:formylglycine-generating enzyme family protein [Okeanomitos corallinicola TIOX110]|uniref:Formylglycine-generating enzyme family protein n=1 Tax=Okeanomitos corallinicola TIOX110 TaxID=3133117 RepID=A0ABZ2UUU2_9CYAN